ncbi:MAG: GspH/FimT family pseudopilin [Burkholderiaceae bacterium]|jgi:type IV fimbrial biogenesis protein FimT|nr:GspH/FimT family pseudopilin [Burkholderiaceae bacterium]
MAKVDSLRQGISGKARQFRAVCGFTLVEILIVLLVGAVLFGLAAPWMRGWVMQHHLSTTTNSLLSAFHLARQTAIGLHRPVSVCAGAAGACHRPAAWDWSKGWIVFVDRNRNGVLDGEEKPLHTGSASHADLALAANSPLRKGVIFTALGFAEQPGGAFAAGRLRICAPLPIVKNARDLVLSKSGRLRLEEADFSGACPAP